MILVDTFLMRIAAGNPHYRNESFGERYQSEVVPEWIRHGASYE
jgi:hypothetical protein